MTVRLLLFLGFFLALGAMIGCNEQIFSAIGSHNQRSSSSTSKKPGFTKQQISSTKSSSDKKKSDEQKKIDDNGDETLVNENDDLKNNTFVAIEDDPTGDTTAASIQESIEDCGAQDMFAADPTQVVYRKKSASVPFITTVGPLKIKTEVILHVEVSPTRTIQKSEINVISVDGLFSSFAVEGAQNEAQKNTATLVIETVAPNDYARLSSKYKIWRGINCTLVAARRLTHIKGDITTVVRFDPPLPISLSPKPIARIFEAEIGNHRRFQNIKATIERSNHEKLRGLNAIMGNIAIKKISSHGNSHSAVNTAGSITPDVGYHMLYNFDSPEITQSLGLAPEISYFISHQSRDLVATIIDPRLVNTPVMTFVYQ